jgi:phosphate transport system substrate-binding protein
MSHQEHPARPPELLSNANYTATEFDARPEAGLRAAASQASPALLNQVSELPQIDADSQPTSVRVQHQAGAYDPENSTENNSENNPDNSTVEAKDLPNHRPRKAEPDMAAKDILLNNMPPKDWAAQLAAAHAESEPGDKVPPMTAAVEPAHHRTSNVMKDIITAPASHNMKPQESHPMNPSAKPDANPNNSAWQAELMNCCQQLAQCAVQELTLPVSAQKLFQDATYRQQVSVELLPLKHPTLTALIHRMNALSAPVLPPDPRSEGTNHSTVATAPTVTPTADMTRVAPSPPAATWKRPAFAFGMAAVLAITLGFGGYHGGFFAGDTRTSGAMTGGANPTALSDLGSSHTAAPQLAAAEQPIAFRLHGSNTIGETLAPAMLEAFLRQQKATHLEWVSGKNAQERQLQFRLPDGRYRIELAAHGSGTAFAGLLQGSADIGMSSRPIHTEELDQLQAVAGDMSKIGNEHIIALDGLAIIVNQNNPVEQLSTAQLAQIFAGTLRNWQQLGGPNQPIRIMARDEQSGTFDTFSQLVLKKHSATLDKAAQRFESSRELSNAVSQHEGAIGFIGLNYVQHNKALAIYDAYTASAASAASADGAVASPSAVAAAIAVPAIVPTRFTIGTEDYALTRRLFLYTPTQASQLVKDFAAFAISDAGQTIVAQHGLVALKIEASKVQAPAQAPALYKQYAQNAQRLSINFRFKQGDEELDNKGKRDLERLVRYLEAHPDKQLVLMGFSDSVGDDATNLALSRKRVAAVATALQRRGVPIAAEEAFGELLPVASNHSVAGQQRNRRVEVWLQ